MTKEQAQEIIDRLRWIFYALIFLIGAVFSK